MTLDALFFQLKHGYILDNKTDANGAEHGGNGQFVSKGGNSGERKETRKKDTSTAKAKELTLEMWGDINEVIEKATPKRSAKTFKEAREILNTFVGKELKSKEGLPGNISGKSVDKLLSGKAVEKSFDLKVHLTAAANIDQLYKNSIEPFKAKKDDDGNPDIKAIHRTYAPMILNENGEKRIIPVKFTVKEYTDKNTKNKLYSIEAIDFDYNKKKETSNLASDSKLSLNPGRFLNNTIAHDGPKSKSLEDLFRMVKGA